MSLLGFMAAGAADQLGEAAKERNKVLGEITKSLIDAEMNDWYQQRRDERIAKADEFKYQRDIERKDFEYTRGREDMLTDEARKRGYKKEDFERTSTHDINKLKLKHGLDTSIEQMRQAGANSRAEMKRKYGILNTSAYSPKEEEADYRRLYDLQTKLHDPMNKLSPQLKETTQNEIDRIQARIRANMPPLNLNALGQ